MTEETRLWKPLHGPSAERQTWTAWKSRYGCIYEHQKDNEVLILRNVTYSEDYDPQSNSVNYTDAFFTKSTDWAHEGECRLVYFQTEKDVPDFKWVDLPANCIKEIYIGYAASEEDKRALLDAIADKPEIKLYQMQLSNKNLFELEPVEIKREVFRYISKWAKIKAFISKYILFCKHH